MIHKHMPPLMSEALKQIPNNKPVSLLLRHSIRESAPHGHVTYQLPLTDEGVALAKWWGGQLGYPIHGLYSSPVERCLDTAKWLAEGAGIEMKIAQERLLVEPGCYVLDGYLASPSFKSMGPVVFTNAFLNETVPGMESPIKGAHRILTYMEERESKYPGITVHVTHDTILAAFIYALIEGELEESDWPQMLEGTFVWFESDSIQLLWRGEQYEIRRARFDDLE